MKIVVDDKNAYIHLRGNNFLCIGPKKEVLKADEKGRAEMVQIAWAFSLFNDIQESKGHSVN